MGVALEWGIANSTDQYVFKIYGGQLSIVRRSTVPLSTEVLVRNGLDPNEISSIQINGKSYNTVQPQIPSGDPFDVEGSDDFPLRQDEYEDPKRARLYHTIEIPRDKFNGDPLNGNAYLVIQLDQKKLPCGRLNLVGMVRLVQDFMLIFLQVLVRQDG